VHRNLPSSKRHHGSEDDQSMTTLPDLAGRKVSQMNDTGYAMGSYDSGPGKRDTKNHDALPPVPSLARTEPSSHQQSDMGSSMTKWAAMYTEDKGSSVSPRDRPSVRSELVRTGPVVRSSARTEGLGTGPGLGSTAISGPGSVRLPSLSGSQTTQGWNSKVAEQKQRLRRTVHSMRRASTARPSAGDSAEDLHESLIAGCKTFR
jgi:hypothetical protein